MTGKPRVVLVTGASAGIGLACADLLHAAGWTVIGASRRFPAGHVAAAVQRVLAAQRPPRRVSAGKAGERVGIVAKRLLPFRIFEAAAKSSLGVG